MTFAGPHSTSSSSNGQSPSWRAASASLVLPPGQIVGDRYKIVSVIGQGAMGCVYKVEQIFLRKIFALKTLHSIAASDHVLRRFQKEAQAASRLEHPNLVRAVDFGLIEGNQPFFVMEFVNGITLDNYLKERGFLSVEELRDIFVPICQGISYAHHEGVIHRDIKPSNIVLVPTETENSYIPRIVDFGIAKLDMAGEIDEQTLTETGEVFGTPLYMSPEQCAGDPIDKRSDIYSLGCVLFEALTGAPPFRGRNALETMMQHRLNEPISLKQGSLGREFSEGLEGIVALMLAKEPGDRYRDCLEVARDLKSLQPSDRQSVRAAAGRSAKGSFFSKLDAMGNSNLTITGRMGSVLLLVWMVVSALVLFALSSNQEPVRAPVKAAAVDDNHEHFLFTALDNTPDDQDLALFVHKHPDIVKIDKTYWRGTNNGLSILRTVHNITDIRFRQCSFITDDGLKYLRHLPLERLDLDDLTITDKGLIDVSQIPTLKYLNLRRTEVGDKGCLLIAGLPALSTLILSETSVTGATLEALAKIPSLKEVFLDQDPPVKNHLKAIACLKLNSLSLARDNITDEDLKTIAQMRSLTYLSLDHDTAITDKGLLKLAQLPHITSLSMRNCNLTQQGMRKFRALKPGCVIANVLTKS